MILLFLRLLLTIGIAFLVGKLVSKLKLSSILGWLIAGMVLGPHALALMNQQLLDAQWYQTVVHVLECGVGLMIGTELVWNKIKRSGKAIVITTLTQSLGTFYHEPADDLEKLEKKRASYYQHYTGKRFGDTQNYDMSLNSGSLGLDEYVKTICSAYRNHTES